MRNAKLEMNLRWWVVQVVVCILLVKTTPYRRDCGLSKLQKWSIKSPWLEQKNRCFFYLSGLREGDRPAIISFIKYVPNAPKSIFKNTVWRSGGEFPTRKRCWSVSFNCNKLTVPIKQVRATNLSLTNQNSITETLCQWKRCFHDADASGTLHHPTSLDFKSN